MTRSSRVSLAPSASRLRRLSAAVLIGITLGFGVFVATSHGLRSMNGGRVGGDFPAFYGAGSLVAAGRTASLYDRAEQRRVQSAFLPDHPGGWIDFAYPPPVALAYVPLAQLPFKYAYVIHSLLMATLCVLAVYLLRPVSPLIRENVLIATAATLAFYPIFRAVVGGQNTALSLLCAAGLLASLQRDDRLRAGLWTGAWLFKPQLAIVVAVVVGLRRGVRFWLGVAIVAAAYYATAALMYGPTWPAWWWHEGVVPFLSADIVMDRGNGISIREVAYELGWPTVGLLLAAVIGMLTGCAGVVRSVQPIALVGIASAGAVLVSVHALFYDGGLALVAILATAEAKRRNLAIPLSLLWAMALVQPLRQMLPIPPITLTLFVVFALALWTIVPRPDDIGG